MGRVNVCLVPDNNDRAMAAVVFVEDWVLRSDDTQSDWRAVFGRTSPFIGLPIIFASSKSSGDISLYGDRDIVNQLSKLPAEVLYLGTQEFDVPGVS